MVFDLQKLLPKERKELDTETRQRYKEHYATVLEKYGYKRDADNSAAFDFFADYFGQWAGAKREECSYPEKGLFVFGEKGTGKTSALQIFSGLFGIDILSIEDLTRAFTCGKEVSFWSLADEYQFRHLIIDDICNEHEAKVFGNTIPLPELLKKREYAWRYDNIYTFFTSNAKNRDEITRLYGDTITSRFLGSCNFIQLGGKDRRIRKKAK